MLLGSNNTIESRSVNSWLRQGKTQTTSHFPGYNPRNTELFKCNETKCKWMNVKSTSYVAIVHGSNFSWMAVEGIPFWTESRCTTDTDRENSDAINLSSIDVAIVAGPDAHQKHIYFALGVLLWFLLPIRDRLASQRHGLGRNGRRIYFQRISNVHVNYNGRYSGLADQQHGAEHHVDCRTLLSGPQLAALRRHLPTADEPSSQEQKAGKS